MRMTASAPKIAAETRLVGLPISGGAALAKLCLFNESRHNNLPTYSVTAAGAPAERDRLVRAAKIATERLDELVREVTDRIGPAEAAIFLAQRMILNDEAVVGQMFQHIDAQGLNAETAITRTLDVYESRLLEVDDAYIKERATDIGEVRRRLLDVLGNMNPALQCQGQEHCRKGRGRIVVAEELTPALTMELDTGHILGFLTERGGPMSHAAILARALGIPAVSGIEGVHRRLSCGAELWLDGDTGEVVVWPGEATVARFGARPEGARLPEVVAPVAELTVMANVSQMADVDCAVKMQAEGIGLYRTEFEFLAAGRILTEDEQFDRYARVVRAMEGRPVYFRMLDLGGDKGESLANLPRQDNPALGARGSRLLLARPDLFDAQARALARASASQGAGQGLDRRARTRHVSHGRRSTPIPGLTRSLPAIRRRRAFRTDSPRVDF